MSRDEQIHVLISHANPLMAAGLKAAFAAEDGFVLAERGELTSASVAVTDCEAGMRLMALKPARACRVLMLTDDESEITIRRAVELGVRGYLSLSTRVDAVVRAVRCIHGGGTAIAPVVMVKMALSLRSRPLTHRELEVLRLIMQGLPDKAIARRLERSVGTAKSHVKAILTKLEASSRLEAVAVARRRGIVPNEPFTAPVDLTRAREMPAAFMSP